MQSSCGASETQIVCHPKLLVGDDGQGGISTAMSKDVKTNAKVVGQSHIISVPSTFGVHSAE